MNKEQDKSTPPPAPSRKIPADTKPAKPLSQEQPKNKNIREK